MTVKIYEVELGNNWSRKWIAASTFEAAYRKAKKLSKDIPSGCGRGVIEKIELNVTADIDVLPKPKQKRSEYEIAFDKAYDLATKDVEKSGDRTNSGFKRQLDKRLTEILEKKPE